MRILLDEEVESRTFPQWSMELFVESAGARNVAANFADMMAAYSRLVTPQARSLVSPIKTAVENPALVATFGRKSTV